MNRSKTKDLIEGHYLETVDGLFFTVKGLHHPKNAVIAYLRYLPDPNGSRIIGNTHYKRVYDLENTYEILRKKYPQYIKFIESKGQKLQVVPLSRIKRVYSPHEKLLQIIKDSRSPLEKTISKFVNVILEESGIILSNIGISGSILIGLDVPSSDIDLIVYGMKPGFLVYEALNKIRTKYDWIKGYNSKQVLKITNSRWGEIKKYTKILQQIEAKKVLHGIVNSRDYFIRLVRDQAEWENERYSKPLETIKIKAIIKNAETNIFTPCSYEINYSKNNNIKYDITQLVSYRGKFTEQVKKGDKIIARGLLEEVEYCDRTIYRLILGVKSDYLIPLVD